MAGPLAFALDAGSPKLLATRQFASGSPISYLWCDGASIGALTSDSSALDIVGDIDLRAAIAPLDWSVAATETIISKYAAGQISYELLLNASGFLNLLTTTDGSTTVFKASTLVPPYGNGELCLVRAIKDVDNGASGNDVKFYTKQTTSASAYFDMMDDNNWTQLGTTVTTAGVTTIFSGTAPLSIGARSSGAPFFKGRIYAACVISGIGTLTGSVVAAVDFTDASQWFAGATTGNSDTGSEWALQGGSEIRGVPPIASEAASLAGYLFCDGTSTASASTPDAAILDVTGDIDIRAAIAPIDWTPGSQQFLLGKWGSPQESFALGFTNSSGSKLSMNWSEDGTTTKTKLSTATITAANGTLLLVRGVLDVDNGAAGNTVTFYTKRSTPEGAYFDLLSDTGWSQLGDLVITATATSIFSGTASLVVGALTGSSGAMNGRCYATCIKDASGNIVSALDFTDPTRWRPAISSAKDETGLLFTLAGAAEIRGIAPQPNSTVRADGAIASQVADDCTSMQCFHQTLVASTDTTITLAQPARIIRVVNWDITNPVLIKDSAISTDVDATATRVGVAPATNVPNTRTFPFLTSTIHLRSAGASVVSIEAFF